RRVAVGDIIIIISYASMEFEEAKSFNPVLIFPETTSNKIN
ncbi:MAG: aspartate 1-decarboxylase, partial [Bacteroidales bacterium]|nr:aspartate 1-decarboxylase [Bacteroidales bacterium]